MQITKFGHSCVLIDDGQTKIIFDPGVWSQIPDLRVDAIIITHIHPDHFNLENIKKLLSNSETRIITNPEILSELEKNEIKSEIVGDGETTTVGSFTLQGVGTDHTVIHPDIPNCKNTGYLVNEKIFHPGDKLTIPPIAVEWLLLPVSAPWSKMEETLNYLAEVNPKVCLPIHDGFLKHNGPFYWGPKLWCEKMGSRFIEPELGQSYEV